MPSFPASTPLERERTTVNTLKTLLLDDSSEPKANLLSLLDQLNIQPDAFRVRNSRLPCPSPTVWNHSSVPSHDDNRSAFHRFSPTYAQLYPSLDPPLHDATQQAIHPSHSFYSTPPQGKRSSFQRPSCHRNLRDRTSPAERKRETRISRRKTRNQSEKKRSSEDCHYRQTITIRQLTCQDIAKSSTKRCDSLAGSVFSEKIRHLSPRKRNFPTELNWSPSPRRLVRPHHSSTSLASTSRLRRSLSSVHNHRKISKASPQDANGERQPAGKTKSSFKRRTRLSPVTTIRIRGSGSNEKCILIHLILRFIPSSQTFDSEISAEFRHRRLRRASLFIDIINSLSCPTKGNSK